MDSYKIKANSSLLQSKIVQNKRKNTHISNIKNNSVKYIYTDFYNVFTEIFSIYNATHLSF